MASLSEDYSIDRILVPLDGSEACASVVPYIAGLAKASEARLILFRAVDSDASTAEADDYLEEIAGDLRNTGMGVATHASVGQPVEAIVEVARDYEADLIAMTGHCQPGGRRDLMGSVAQGVLSQCEVPVIAVRLDDTQWVQPGGIVVGLDGSEDAHRAMWKGVALARALKCGLTIVRAVEPVAPLGGAARYYGTVDDFADDYIQKIKEELVDTGVDVSTHVGKRTPEQELLGVAGSKPGSIIVVATSGMTGTPGVLGSTTDRLVRAQQSPVFAVPA